MTLFLFSLIALFIAITGHAVFGDIGTAIAGFMLGVGGYFTYPILALCVVCSLKLLTGKQIVSAGWLLRIGFVALCAFLIVHLATSAQYIGEGYGGYLGACWNAAGESVAASTGGGVLLGLVVFPCAFLLSSIGAYVLFGCLAAFSLFLVVMATPLKEVILPSYKSSREHRERAKESRAAASQRRREIVFDDLPESRDGRRGAEDDEGELMPLRPRTQPPAPQPQPAQPQPPYGAPYEGQPYFPDRGYGYESARGGGYAPAGGPAPAPQAFYPEPEPQEEAQDSRSILFRSDPAYNYKNNLAFNRDDYFNSITRRNSVGASRSSSVAPGSASRSRPQSQPKPQPSPQPKPQPQPSASKPETARESDVRGGFSYNERFSRQAENMRDPMPKKVVQERPSDADEDKINYPKYRADDPVSPGRGGAEDRTSAYGETARGKDGKDAEPERMRGESAFRDESDEDILNYPAQTRPEAGRRAGERGESEAFRGLDRARDEGRDRDFGARDEGRDRDFGTRDEGRDRDFGARDEGRDRDFGSREERRGGEREIFSRDLDFDRIRGDESGLTPETGRGRDDDFDDESRGFDLEGSDPRVSEAREEKEEFPPKRRVGFGDEEEPRGFEEEGFDGENGRRSRVFDSPISDSDADLFDDAEPMEEAEEEEEREPARALSKRDVPAPRPKHIYPPYQRPSMDLFAVYDETVTVTEEEIDSNSEIIIETLAGFRVDAKIVRVTCGSSVTKYDIDVPHSVTVRAVIKRSAEIALRLRARDGVNIYSDNASGAISIEVPNAHRATVGLRSVLESKDYTDGNPGALMFGIGKDIDNRSVCGNIVKMKHILVAGSTGSGKSVCLNAILISLICKYSPEDLRLILIDPKRVEFTVYEGLPHLMINEIISDAKKAITALNWATKEMERRYDLFEQKTRSGKFGNVKEIDDYNKNLSPDEEKLPRIVVVVDELADLMSVAKKDIEDKIQRLAQKARAAGVHLIIATQRPSVDVITGTIKGNLPTRVAFRVIQEVDSRTIIDESGAEKLLGNGDMLYRTEGLFNYKRVQGAYISPSEVEAIVNYIKMNNEAYYDDTVAEYINREEVSADDVEEEDGDDDGSGPDPTYIKALAIVVKLGSASISLIQRKCSVGYNHAGKIIDWMESMKYISEFDGKAKARTVLLTKEDFESKYGPLD